MKLLLYCTKAKPKLMISCRGEYKLEQDFKIITDKAISFNGKIVAECDYEVEEITYAPNPSAFDRANFSPKEWGYDYQEKYGGLSNEELLKHSCLTNKELSDYLNTPTNDKKTFCKDTFGYEIHIKNLHIFDEPRDIRNYYTNRIYNKIEDVYTDEIQIKSSEWVRPIKNAPQNMMYAYDNEEKKILISIRPEWLCKILNGEKTIEVRKKVLKEMLK